MLQHGLCSFVMLKICSGMNFADDILHDLLPMKDESRYSFIADTSFPLGNKQHIQGS